MARHSPTGFAFGMLLEIAAVVVIVSLLPRLDLRPKTAAGEVVPSVENTLPASAQPAKTDEPSLEEILIPISQRFGASQPRDDRSPPALSQPQLASHEVEQRLDRASQGLVNTLGAAATDLASGVMHSASRPAVQATAPPPSWTAPNIMTLPPPPAFKPAAQTPTATMHRRWINY